MFISAFEGRHCVSCSETYEICPKVVINVYLSGSQRFVIDGTPFQVGAGRAGNGAAISMINISRRSRIRFCEVEPGPCLRKIKLQVPLVWLEREVGDLSVCSPVLRRFLSTHLSHFHFVPRPDLVELAEQISHPPPDLKGELLTLYRKARGIELMRLTCAALVTQDVDAGSKPPHLSARQNERVRHYILANLSESLTIETIARECGASVSSVQRHFKQQFGITVFEFIRRERLVAAHDALVRRGVSVAEAAWIAGYLSASSFTTAFKQTYGRCPKEVRR